MKKTILQARKDWESGKLQGQESVPASAVRMRGSGPPPELGAIEELLTRYYARVVRDLHSICPRPLARVKATQLMYAARDEGVAQVAKALKRDGSTCMQRMDRFVHR